MQDAFVQAIRYKLQKRVRRLNSADYQHFPMLLRVFFHVLRQLADLERGPRRTAGSCGRARCPGDG